MIALNIHVRAGFRALLLVVGFVVLLFGAFYTPVDAAGTTLFVSPASGTHLVGQSFSVTVKIDSASEINAAEATLGFPSDILSVKSISRSGAIFNLWVQEPTLSGDKISFKGGLPGGFSGIGSVYTVTFQANKAGTAIVYFLGGSRILANDGVGTNILSTVKSGTYIINRVATPTPTIELPPVVGVPETPVVFSPTHPDPQKWYSNDDVVVEWSLPEGVIEVKLVLNRKPRSTPTVRYVPPISTRTIEDLEDGVWYIHVQFRNAAGLGLTSTFKFNVDTQPPNDFEIIRVDRDDPTNPRPELFFATDDSLSGIDRYEMKLGDGDWFVIDRVLASAPYALPLQAPGEHFISVRAYDRANNFSEAAYTLQVESIEPPIVDEIPEPVKRGEPFTITGTAEPFFGVKVFIQDPLVELNTTADENGDWSAIHDIRIPAGEHEIHAYAIDKRGAVSVVSNRVTIRVEGITFGLPLLIIIIVIIILIILYRNRKRIFKRKLKKGRIFGIIGQEKKKEQPEALTKGERQLIRRLRNMHKDIKDEIRLLDTLSKRRGLNRDEKYLRSKLSQYLKVLKVFDGE